MEVRALGGFPPCQRGGAGRGEQDASAHDPGEGTDLDGLREGGTVQGTGHGMADEDSERDDQPKGGRGGDPTRNALPENQDGEAQ
ncbi:hypothetical protein D3C72_1403920 [compost metagenome]